MKKRYFKYLVSVCILVMLTTSCKMQNKKDVLNSVLPTAWKVDFIDNFDTFNAANWQDQRIWVNNETHCYVPNGEFGTREVSAGSLKLRVINTGEKSACDNLDKHGKQHPETQYVAGRITSKNKQEFVKGKWTARLKLASNGKPSMFPAWWILGAQNNELPVKDADENICWPLTGSGEIDIFEHHGDHQKNHFTAGAIKSLEECDKGDWWSLRKGFDVTLNEYHEYAVAWEGSDLVYSVDNKEIYRNIGQGDKYPEKMFAILNFAKITDAPMEGEWEMEVDWVKHEFRD